MKDLQPDTPEYREAIEAVHLRCANRAKEVRGHARCIFCALWPERRCLGCQEDLSDRTCLQQSDAESCNRCGPDRLGGSYGFACNSARVLAGHLGRLAWSWCNGLNERLPAIPTAAPVPPCQIAMRNGGIYNKAAQFIASMQARHALPPLVRRPAPSLQKYRRLTASRSQGGSGDRVIPEAYVSVLSELTDRAPFHPLGAPQTRQTPCKTATPIRKKFSNRVSPAPTVSSRFCPK